MVEQQGYEHDQFETETEDGYILQMSRVPNKMTFEVVFFMHGIFDKSWTWLCHGPGESIGYEARDAGYDVFLGNYRGVYPRKLAEWKQKQQDCNYWDYSIDHIAKFDIYAFIHKIFETKVEEFKEREND